jgi:HAD superfamily hydrolase (TIGR01509 family)
MEALLFDCDGVLADTERFGHLPAFNQLFRDVGLPVSWSDAEYAEKLRIAGGKERLASLLTPELVARAGLPADPAAQKAMIARWHERKSAIFARLLEEGAVPARPGIRRIVAEAAGRGVRLAVASTSTERSVRLVLERAVGRELAARFLVLAGDVVPRKKPAPDVYLLALQRLDVPAAWALAIEDSRNGLLAARAAGLEAVVTLSSYTWDEDMAEARLVLSDLGEPDAPMRVVANRSAARPGAYATLADLQACLADPGEPRA